MGEHIDIEKVDNGCILKWRALKEVYDKDENVLKRIKEILKEKEPR